ncbi:extracellular solute-binding protein [Vineibacter terrae]|uniref:extracellular solute-binding protein n=1 Tax=Vineibacter terrae TaxID=2586908 RepID=UPI002E310826|nr:extracellular solute-binding protein [Vineibacter terrae]HEX2885194.1 extracellular solute-binding protein [Vineibacter terrae]
MSVRAGLAVLLGLFALSGLAGPPAKAQGRQAPITIVINQSPWFAGFAKLVEAYEKETGNKVTLDVNPFAGAAEKQRNSVRAKEGIYDLLPMNSAYLAEFYYGGFLTPLNEIDPEFKLDPQVLSYDDTAYWDEERKANSAKSGKLYGVPINGNVPVLYYREDLYKANGLKVPETWDELLANAKALHKPPQIYGMVLRAARSASDISYDWMPYLHSFGGAIFRDEKAGDFTVTLNSPAAKAALEQYLAIAKSVAPPNPGSFGQGQVIQLLLTGKVAHAMNVIAAWSQMDDPTKSAVVDKINVAVAPKGPGGVPAPTLGHFIGGIPKNVPPERKKAALAFLAWFQKYESQVKYAEFGSPPVRMDVLGGPMSKERKNRFMKALLDSAPYARMMHTIPEGAQINAVLELRLNQAVIGEQTPAAALNLAAQEVFDIASKAGYRTGRLPDLQ